MVSRTFKIGNFGARIDPLIFKDWSLGADTTKFLNQSHKDQSFIQQRSILAKKRIFREYSFKDRSFHFHNSFFEIHMIWESRFLCQRSTLGLQGSILQRQTALHITKMWFFWIVKRLKAVLGQKCVFSSDF